MWQAVKDFFTTTETYFIGICVGLLAKLSYELYMKRTLSIIQWLAVIAISIFCGYITSSYLLASGHDDMAQYLVPLATLFGEKVVVYFMENYKSILGGLLSIVKRKSDGEKK